MQKRQPVGLPLMNYVIINSVPITLQESLLQLASQLLQ